MNHITWNQAVMSVNKAGFSYGGFCSCPARIHKYVNGKFQIHMSQTSFIARLLQGNATIKIDKVENIQTLIERSKAETNVPA